MTTTAAKKKTAELTVGMKAPDFAVAFDSSSSGNITSESLKGKHKVIYFYQGRHPRLHPGGQGIPRHYCRV